MDRELFRLRWAVVEAAKAMYAKRRRDATEVCATPDCVECGFIRAVAALENAETKRPIHEGLKT